MRVQLAAKAVSRPQAGATAIQQRIPCPFERQVRRQLEYFEIMAFEPFLEMSLLALAFAMQKPAQDDLLANRYSRICRENHVRQTGCRLDTLNPAPFS